MVSVAVCLLKRELADVVLLNLLDGLLEALERRVEWLGLLCKEKRVSPRFVFTGWYAEPRYPASRDGVPYAEARRGGGRRAHLSRRLYAPRAAHGWPADGHGVLLGLGGARWTARADAARGELEGDERTRKVARRNEAKSGAARVCPVCESK